MRAADAEAGQPPAAAPAASPAPSGPVGPGIPATVPAGPGRHPREAPLVPAGTVAGRALVSLVAVMTFLAGLSAGAAVLVSGASRDWGGAIAHEATVQVVPTPGRDLEADMGRAAAVAAASPGVSGVEPYGGERVAKLLEPWLGAGLDLADLPVPRLIALRLDPAARGFDAEGLAAALRSAVPGATLDDGGAWRARLAGAADAVEAAAVAVCALMSLCLGLAVGFATRGAVAGTREIIGVLRFVGAEDRYIARQFQRRFLRLGAQGAAAGGGLACLAFALAGLAAGRPGGPETDGIGALFGRFALGPSGYGTIGLVAVGTALVTGWTSHALVVRHLRDME